MGADRLGGWASALEGATGLSRIALVAAALVIAQRRAGLTTDEAQVQFSESWPYLKANWAAVLVMLGVVGLAAAAANGALWWTVRQIAGSSPDGGDSPTTLAVVFAIKNLTVIPLFVLAGMRVLRWVPHQAAR